MPDKGVYFMMFDYQYNNKLLQKIDHTFKLPDNQSASKTLNIGMDIHLTL